MGRALASGLLLICMACSGGRAPGEEPLPDGGSGSLTSPDGGAQLDAGQQQADDCTGAVPAAPGSASTFVVTSYSDYTCTLASSDGSGAVIAEAHQGPLGATTQWFDKGARGEYASFAAAPIVVPQQNGFYSLAGSGSSMFVQYTDENGNPTPGATFDGSQGATLIPEYGGAGVVSLVQHADSISLQPYVATAGTARTISTTSALLGAAQDASGDVLVVTAGLTGYWAIYGDNPYAAPIDLGSGSSAIARAMIGGGVAVRVDGRWIGIAHPGAATLEAPRPWMTDGSDFAPIHSGAAYAVLGNSNTVGIAVGHTTCGSVQLPGVSSVSIGFDGTAIGPATASGCVKAWWPAYFK